MYYHKFPSAPIALVSGISATCRIPSIVDARVGRDGSIYLDVMENEHYVVRYEDLHWLADFCGVTLAEISAEDGYVRDGEKILSVTVSTSVFDFSDLFPPEGYVDDERGFRLVGEEDSVEGIEALAALAASRRD